MRTVGIVLIIIGVVMFLAGGLKFRQKEKVLDVGALEVNKTEEKKVVWPSYAGGVVLVAGIVLVVAGSRTKK